MEIEQVSGGESVQPKDERPVDEEVEEILMKAFQGELVDRVDLSGRQLIILPEPFGKLHALLSLNLSHNQLQVRSCDLPSRKITEVPEHEAIPDSIAGLVKLEELNLSANLLQSLPDSIGLLINLKILDVSGNKLKALPATIAGCRALVELDASYNNLTILPKNIGYGLSNLEKMNVSLNKLCILPISICEIKPLRYLDVHFNELHGLPPAIGMLTNLEFLNASSNFNDLKQLPETICNAANLRDLDLSNNQIRVLPDGFYRLESLSGLNLDQNPLVIPPPEIAKEGAEAVKEFMRKRMMEMVVAAAEERMAAEENKETQTGWLAWGSSMVNNLVSEVSRGYSDYFGGNAPSPSPSPKAWDPFLDQPR